MILLHLGRNIAIILYEIYIYIITNIANMYIKCDKKGFEMAKSKEQPVQNGETKIKVKTRISFKSSFRK